MDAANEALRLVGHVISLDKMLTRIARLAHGSMLAGVRTHQQTTQTNRTPQCNWHYIVFFIWAFFWYRRRTFKHRLNDKKTFFCLNV
jgi:hypothetical protein